ncbi:MAG TPA: hypothetical protein VK324_06170 [Tepidisphaeraceae bacterium]|nr:hypothetical protein [Tepidisphaeraceae bacterium]
MSDATPQPPPAPDDESDDFGIIEQVAKQAAEAVPVERRSVAEDKALFRAEQTRDVVHWIVIWGLRAVGLVAILVVTLRIAHLALPPKCQFIPSDQLAHIDSLFLSGGVAIAISRHLRSVMGWEEDGER